MATTKQIAEQLHKLAEHIDALPEAEAGKLLLINTSVYDKDLFKVQASMMPRPIIKEVKTWSTNEELQLEHDTKNGIKIQFSIDRKYVCRIVKPAQPAEFECEPIFSVEEEAAL